MRVAINATALLSPATGIAFYARNLAQAIGELSEIDMIFFYAWSWSPNLRHDSVPGIESVKGIIKKVIPHPYEAARLFKQWRFDAGIRGYAPDVYHEPNYLPFRFDGPTVITVHDLSHIRYPETHPKPRVRAMNKYLLPAIERAARIIVDSDFVKTEVVRHFGVDPAKVDAIHLGVGKSFSPRSRDKVTSVLARFDLTPKEYIFAVGTLEPRKNLVQALDAHAALPERMRKELPLIVVGMKGWLAQGLQARIRVAEERGEVRWLGYVPADALPALYSGARLFVYPSLYEGFGLPVLEAMASGIPVVTSNQASLPEVAGDAAIMVDPHDRDAMRDAMLRLIEDGQEARRRVDLGLAQAAKFTWRACAERTLIVYREALQAASRK